MPVFFFDTLSLLSLLLLCFQAILGVDIVCQAKSGMGKTAVFVLATLHQLNPQPGEVRERSRCRCECPDSTSMYICMSQRHTCKPPCRPPAPVLLSYALLLLVGCRCFRELFNRTTAVYVRAPRDIFCPSPVQLLFLHNIIHTYTYIHT